MFRLGLEQHSGHAYNWAEAFTRSVHTWLASCLPPQGQVEKGVRRQHFLKGGVKGLLEAAVGLYAQDPRGPCWPPAACAVRCRTGHSAQDVTSTVVLDRQALAASSVAGPAPVLGGAASLARETSTLLTPLEVDGDDANGSATGGAWTVRGGGMRCVAAAGL